MATLIAAVMASAPPGLLNVNAAKISVEKGRKNGIMFSLGIAVMVMFQAYLAVRIAKFLSRNPEIIAWLMKAAVLIFAVLAVFFLIKASKSAKEPVTLEKGDMRNSFTKGMFLAALNLLQIPFYSGLNTFFHTQGIMNYEILDEVLFILGAGLGTFLVMYSYVLYFNKLENNTNTFSKNSNYILSGLMILLLIITLIRISYE
ncbi:LysE family translocator [Muricauda sp. SCSIO 64092]|uniref:LysE family transporter n=1 Tax=Allomuricauda sp. SCSIO 64092 TaxID=2908842 RepID=UPI001FF11F62|nr:LysE family transporter [Muricauda sp. SCSIO 64092]UOY04805.1 LysE family translocator [Muricauda sp. SCSIO 64092]